MQPLRQHFGPFGALLEPCGLLPSTLISLDGAWNDRVPAGSCLVTTGRSSCLDPSGRVGSPPPTHPPGPQGPRGPSGPLGAKGPFGPLGGPRGPLGPLGGQGPASAKATRRRRSFVLGHHWQIRIPTPHPPPRAPGPTGRFGPLGWPRGRLASLVHGICPSNTEPWEIDAQPWEIGAQPWEIDPHPRSPDPKHRSPTADTPNVPTHNPGR